MAGAGSSTSAACAGTRTGCCGGCRRKEGTGRGRNNQYWWLAKESSWGLRNAPPHLAQPLRGRWPEGHARSTRRAGGGGRVRPRAHTPRGLVGRGERVGVAWAPPCVIAAAAVVVDERLDAAGAAAAPPSPDERSRRRPRHGDSLGGVVAARGSAAVVAVAAGLDARRVVDLTWAAAVASRGPPSAHATSSVTAAAAAQSPPPPPITPLRCC